MMIRNALTTIGLGAAMALTACNLTENLGTGAMTLNLSDAPGYRPQGVELKIIGSTGGDDQAPLQVKWL